MPNLLAMSFEAQLAPSFDLRCPQPGRTPPAGRSRGHALGSLDLVLSDGRGLLAYADRCGPAALHMGEMRPPYVGLVLGDADLRIGLRRRGSKNRKGVVIASEPMATEGQAASVAWRRL